MESMGKVALFFAIAGLVCNLLMISISGVPVGIPLGIFGIAFSTLSKEAESRRLTAKGRTALILSIVSLVVGFIIFAMAIAIRDAMADPEMSRKIIEAISEVKDQFPEEMQEMFEQAGIPLE